MHKLYALITLAALVACSDPPPEEDAGITLRADARPTLNDAQPRPDQGAAEDALIEDAAPDDMGEDVDGFQWPPLDDAAPPVDPDEGLPRLDAAQPDEPMMAIIALAEVPDAQEMDERASAAVSVAPWAALGEDVGCVSVSVDPNAPAPATVSADGGAISVTGAVGGALPFTYAAGAYSAARALNGDVFSDGAALNVSGVGGPRFPAFSVDLTAPTSVRVDAPSSLSQHSVGGDLSVRWGAGQAESVLVTIIPVDFSGGPLRGSWIFCGVDDAGAASVPAAQLRATLNNNPIGQMVIIALTRTRVATADIGPHRVVFSASTSGGALITLVP